jgi:phosphinothricin acetyltransferase
MQIRIAEPADLASIVAIYNQAVEEQATADTEPLTVEARRSWFDEHAPARRPILVAQAAGGIAGWAALSDYRAGRRALRHTAEISYYVHRGQRRQGVATRLVRAAMDLGPALAVRSLFSVVLDDNAASIRLVESLGFERWGHLPRVADFDGREVGHLVYGLRLR